MTCSSVSSDTSQPPNPSDVSAKIPATGRSSSAPFWNVIATLSPTAKSRSSARVLVDEHAAVGDALVAALDDIQVEQLLHGERIGGADAALLAFDLGIGHPHRCDGGQLRDLGERLGHDRRQPLEGLVGDDVVGLDGVLEDVGERRPQRRGEHRRRADQRHADHQRRRSGRRPPWRPPGVLPGEDARRTEHLGDRPADGLRHRPGHRGRHAGHAEEDHQRADTRQGDEPERPPGRRNSPRTNITAPTTATVVPTTSRRVLSASKPSSGRMAATGRDPGRPAGRHDHRQQRDADADDDRHDDAPRQQHRAGVREAESGRVEQRAACSFATRTPPPIPIAVAMTDITSAST